MAKARMVHKKICTSEDVNKLPLPGRLLFTWLITAADDDGRIKGEATYIKVEVVPYTNWAPKIISGYLTQMKDIGLINYWQQDGRWYIDFPKWKEHQYIAKDRYHPSLLPSYKDYLNSMSTSRIQPVYKLDTQSNITKSNEIKVNKSEHKADIADKNMDLVTNRDKSRQFIGQQSPTNTYKNRQFPVEHPSQYKLQNEKEVGAKMAWEKLEPNNPTAFYTTYLNAAHKGLPASRFYLFVSEIKQSNTKNPGAVFNTKVKDYFDKKTV